ncbi:hypothetical protein ABZV58_31120 [Nocardia sp. NPDC004654]|uniref:hypothetical protein n=1 Tax=Nocardia sp. NPDC004654 TaxID=3154776 RepID=UPI0033BD6D73
MTRPNPQTRDEVAGFGDCLTDPGELSTDAAITALSLHHACPHQCQVQGRALDTLEENYGHLPAAEVSSAAEFGELDRHLVDSLREYHRLAQLGEGK